MKRRWFLFSIILMLVLTACSDNDDSKNQNGCLEEETYIDGECIKLNAIEKNLYKTVENMNEQTNYMVEINVQTEENSYTFDMYYNESVSVVIDDNKKTYYINDNGACKMIVKQNNIIKTEVIPCEANDQSLRFYREFSYKWFDIVDGSTYLHSDYYQGIKDSFELGTMYDILEVELHYSAKTFDEMLITLSLENELLILTFDFKDYGDVTITPPSQ